MAQCKKCGRYEHVVSESSGYWWSAIKWTFGSVIFTYMVLGDIRLKGNYLAYGICVFVIITSIKRWFQTFSGATYFENECKDCGNKWTTDD